MPVPAGPGAHFVVVEPDLALDPAILRSLVAEQNDATLEQYAERLAERTGGRRFAPSMLSRALRRLDLPRKKDAARE